MDKKMKFYIFKKNKNKEREDSHSKKVKSDI